MIKINSTDLKGFALILERGKERYEVATFDSVVAMDKETNKPLKNNVVLHLVQGNTFTGDIVAELPSERVLMLKGSFYSRDNTAKSSENRKVGQLR